MVEQGSDLTRLQSGEVLVRLHYGGTGTGKPLISEISRKFNVNTNIHFWKCGSTSSHPFRRFDYDSWWRTGR